MSTTRASAAAMLAPATIVVVLVLALPLVLLLRYSLNHFEPGQFMVEALTLENYAKLVSDPYYLGVLRTTVLMALAVTAACLALGFPLALAIARAEPRLKAVLIVLVVVPLFVGNAVRAAGWMVAFGQKGLVNAVLESVGLSPATIMYTPLAVFIGIISVNLPFVVLTLQSVIEGIDRALGDAAASLGATPFATWRLVTVPLALPGLLAAGALSFILTMNAYATPLLLGGPRFQMMGPTLANEILAQANWPFGASLAFVLIAFTLASTALANILIARTVVR
ncbi:MAG TPA: ABC transporter permease [Xanthobacteraceae bacterium]|nr:ABC transporter permease [Xanthobacteraceae bacterium]